MAACLAEHVPDAEERAWVRPRLANLLGLEERADTDRQDLFAAWRLFFERLSDQGPLILVFEDLQWADQALLAFVEYLLEWSSGQRLYVLALSRPELTEQHPDFARGVRNSMNLAMEPLSHAEMTALLDGYVPGLPDDLRAQVLARAQGVPLYAVETVRMLLDRGLLVLDGPVYRPTGEIATLEVPETLHALAAARLDGLPADERRLVQQACVLGKTFTKEALAALTGQPELELDALLAGLVRKEFLSLQADPRSPGRGQYGFLQELLRQVAYETLSRHDRKRRHLAAVAALELTVPGADQEFPEVIAAHLLAAADAAAGDADTGEIQLQARTALAQAGERAAALAAPGEAQRYLDQAAALADDDPHGQAGLLSRAGTFAYQAGNTAAARERLERAIRLYEQEEDAAGAAWAGVRLSDVDLAEGRLEEGTRRLEAALATLEKIGPSPELAATFSSLGRLQTLRGDPEAGAATLERALRLAEELALDETFVQALNNRAMALMFEARLLEGGLLLEGVVARARAKNHHGWWRAANNLAQVLLASDRYTEALELNDELEAHHRQRGDREMLAFQSGGALVMLSALGRWEEVLERAADVERIPASRWARSEVVEAVPVLCEQGKLDAAQALLLGNEWQREAEQAEVVVSFSAVEARLLRAQRRPIEALAAAERGLANRSQVGIINTYVKRCLLEALEAVSDLDDLDRLDELLRGIDALMPGERTPSLEAQRARFQPRLDTRRGQHGDAERDYGAAEALFAELGLIFHHAATQLEHAEWLTSQDRGDAAQPLLAEARGTFERLEARPWLERVEAAQAGTPARVSA